MLVEQQRQTTIQESLKKGFHPEDRSIEIPDISFWKSGQL